MEGYLCIFDGYNTWRKMKNIKQLIVIAVCVILFSGCAKLSKMNELLRLKELSDEQIAMEKSVEKDDALFDLLLNDFKEGKLEKGETVRNLVDKYGWPILERSASEGSNVEEWIYRYSLDFFGSPKVYLYIQDGKLTDWKYVEGNENGDDNGEIKA